MRIISAFIISVLLMCACTMPETKIYSLYVSSASEKGNPAVPADKSIAVLVSSPRYLSQSFIAYRSSPYELEISKYSKWEASPQEMFRTLARNYLSSTGMFREVRASSVVPEGFYTLEVALKRFDRDDRTAGSYGELTFDYELYSPDGIELYRGSVSKEVRLENRTFINLAKGMSALSEEAVKEMAENLKQNLRK
ncbi:MAG TPA: ABC-type transport auxiliary lipoprotein family protein [Thermodesulfovibrionales bacterium]|nr:ABC-type transport auxiliary lipoprotein family protein [Thermodesulfovibrionales bacterium]